jgi:energy-coupling factor transport system ATP-binding protein
MIETRDLTFRYPQASTNVLKHVSLKIPENGLVCIMGSNGSGKSTLARCFNGLLSPTSGQVNVDGWTTSDPGERLKILRRTGLVFQNPHLQMTSVTIERELAFGLENIGMPPAEMHETVHDSLKEFGFLDRKHEPPSILSGGEMQMLALASVMILKPSYLILDEATSLLSVRSRVSIMRKVLELRKKLGIGVVIITQFPSEALLAERLAVLHGGNIVFDDKPGEVFRNAKALSEMGVPIPIRERLRMVV